MKMLSIQPRDFIETKEGLLFAAIDEKTAFLRFFPSRRGKRFRNKTPYRKVSSTESSFEYLEKKFPMYIETKKGYRIQCCPLGRISRVHRPIEKLRLIRALEGEESSNICITLDRILDGIPEDHKGVTGSHLVDLATPASDVDFVIYGNHYFESARKILKYSSEIENLSNKEGSRYFRKRFPDKTTISLDSFKWHEQRKFNLGKVDGVLFNLLLVGRRIDLREGEAIKKVRIKCRVLDAKEAFNLPSVYHVDHDLVNMVVSFTHTFAGQAFGGEQIEVSGMLEKIEKGGYRVVVGTSREAVGEFIKVLKPV
jgi:predicted nucleotidyltransferase